MRKLTILFAAVALSSATFLSCSKDDDDSAVSVQKEYPVPGWQKDVMMGDNGDILRSYSARGYAYLTYSGVDYLVVANTITGSMSSVSVKTMAGTVIATGTVIIEEREEGDINPLPTQQKISFNANSVFASRYYQ